MTSSIDITPFVAITAFLWPAFYLYWFISALGAKRNVQVRGGALLVRIAVLLVAIAAVAKFPGIRHDFNIPPENILLNSIGIVMLLAGLGLAVWARIYLGRNWGMPMTLKKDPELVTGGPYSIIRNPIYSGLLLALLGTALVDGLFWLVVSVFAGIYFIYSSKVEEKIMAEQFPQTYPEYKKRTKALIPFIF